MTYPNQTQLSAEQQRSSMLEAIYVSPDSIVIKDYAHKICEQLGKSNANYSNPEIVSGFTSFLNFVAERLTKYMNTEHREYLLRGQKKSSSIKR